MAPSPGIGSDLDTKAFAPNRCESGCVPGREPTSRRFAIYLEEREIANRQPIAVGVQSHLCNGASSAGHAGWSTNAIAQVWHRARGSGAVQISRAKPRDLAGNTFTM